MQPLTHTRALELLEYDPISGLFNWKQNRNNRTKAGDEAGFIFQHTGYRIICIDDCNYQAQRLAWFLQTGCWPVDEADHINHIRHDNRFVNLREVSRLENMKNKSKNSNNSSGFTGVYKTKFGNWIARICVNRKHINLGTYSRIEDAVAARQIANFQYGFHANHGK